MAEDAHLESVPSSEGPLNLAIVKLCKPELLEEEALTGIAKTLSHLRKLGLLSVVVLDDGAQGSRSLSRQQTHRIQQAFDTFGSPSARVLSQIITGRLARDAGYFPSALAVRFPRTLLDALYNEAIVIIPPVCLSYDLGTASSVDADEIIMALVKYFSGLQFDEHDLSGLQSYNPSMGAAQIASIERLIILDPIGGIPLENSTSSHRFINLEQEFTPVMDSLARSGFDETSGTQLTRETRQAHARNLKLTRSVLSILPPAASSIITTPYTAATKPTGGLPAVSTRNRLNPLIHNLLTDKPVFSPSLPLERIRPEKAGEALRDQTYVATVVKRGMPLTIFPDPSQSPWTPPQPGKPRLRLTDTCIDLARLQHLVEDSFGRKLDIRDYLERVNDNLAGVIIAGQYEGGAILTWESPHGLDAATAYEQNRLVPYLDKFAVLRSRQGSGGVADVVFNAMVRSCFPSGVCWRSRKDNPVNKWYFERSLGTCKLPETQWTMFWTTPHIVPNSSELQDYEDVCRHIESSWLDRQQPAD